MITTSITTVQGRQDFVKATLRDLDIGEDRYTSFTTSITIQECSDEEMTQLLQLLIKLKSNWYIRSFTIQDTSDE